MCHLFLDVCTRTCFPLCAHLVRRKKKLEKAPDEGYGTLQCIGYPATFAATTSAAALTTSTVALTTSIAVPPTLTYAARWLGRGRPGWGGGAGRGRRRGGMRRPPPPSREQLDKEIESYMSGTR